MPGVNFASASSSWGRISRISEGREMSRSRSLVTSGMAKIRITVREAPAAERRDPTCKVRSARSMRVVDVEQTLS